MPRTVPEWIGKTDDSRPPPRVLQRVWERYKGTCHICGGEIGQKKWEADHVKALINGGQNRESNLAPAHVPCHKGKTAKDVEKKAKVARKAQKHSGAKRPKGKMKSPGFPIVEKTRKIDKAAIDRASVAPKRRSLFK